MNQNSGPRPLDGDLGYSCYLGKRRHAVILGFPEASDYEFFLVYRGNKKDADSVCKKLGEHEKNMEFLQYLIPNNIPLEGIFDGKIHQLPPAECRKVLGILKPLQLGVGRKSNISFEKIVKISSYLKSHELSSILSSDDF